VSARDTQVGGDHYVEMTIQPAEFCEANGLSYCESMVVRYISRWRDKNGIEDLEKAQHMIQYLIEMEADRDADTRDQVDV